LPTLNDWENHLTTIFPEVHICLLSNFLIFRFIRCNLQIYAVSYFLYSGQAEEILGDEGS
jgi:gamma-glutamylcysteine synthetase